MRVDGLTGPRSPRRCDYVKENMNKNGVISDMTDEKDNGTAIHTVPNLHKSSHLHKKGQLI